MIGTSAAPSSRYLCSTFKLYKSEIESEGNQFLRGQRPGTCMRSATRRIRNSAESLNYNLHKKQLGFASVPRTFSLGLGARQIIIADNDHVRALGL